LIAALIAAGAQARYLKAPGVEPQERYRPSRALREFVIARDLTCRIPGCDRAADWGDLDHSIAWSDGGTTHASNLNGKCRHHHVVKTFREGWKEAQSPDGTLHVTDPTGHTYTSIPTSRLLFPAARTTSAAVQRGSPRKLSPEGNTTGQPRRRRSRAKERAYRIAAERARNEAYLAMREKAPPF